MARFWFIVVSGFVAGLLVVIVVLGIIEIAEVYGYEPRPESSSGQVSTAQQQGER